MEIPTEVQFVIKKLRENNYEAYVVGGCVRDLLRGVEPQDWDVSTNAKPVEIGQIFLRSYTDNKFGTVTILTDSKDPRLKKIEITPFRIEEKYTDKRHPDQIKWAGTVEEDLTRRDFTINAMALEIQNSKFKVIDPYDGQKDLKNRIIRTVDNPADRFSEDALRMIRAVRFATLLGFEIEPNTIKAIQKNGPWLQAISKERIRDELMKIIMTDRAAEGIELLRKVGLLHYIIPELEENYAVTQNKHHIYDCYEHALRSLDYGVKKNYNKYVQLAALLHDIAKPRTKRGEGPDATFYGHQIVGAKMTAKILQRLKFPKKDIEKVAKLVRYHFFYYNVDEVSEASVRRLVRQVGPENMEELLQVRFCDRIGSGVPKAEPYKLRHLRYIIEKVSKDPISVKMLVVGGHDIMEVGGMTPGPGVGHILSVLLDIVLSYPQKNKKEILIEEVKRLNKLSEEELAKLAQKAEKERQQLEMKRDEMTKKKYWVS